MEPRREYTAEELGLSSGKKEFTSEELGLSSSSIPKLSVSEIKPTPEREKISASRIGGAALMGGATGALLPEVLGIASLIPGPQSPFLAAGSLLARGGRAAGALTGALAGGGGELAGQAERRFGKPDQSVLNLPGVRITREDIARTAGEFGAPAIPAIGAKLIRGMPMARQAMAALEKYSGVGGKALQEEAAGGALSRIRGKEDATETSYYRDIFDSLQKVDEKIRGEASGAIVSAGMKADEIMASARLKALSIIKTDKAAADKIIADGEIQAQKLVKDAMDNVAQKIGIRRRAESAGRKAEAKAVSSSQQIGDVNRTNADTGTSLREKIVSVQGERIANRQKQFDADNKIVLDEVSAKESANNFVENLPAYKEIIDGLNKTLLQGKVGKEQITAETTEQGILTQLNRVLDALKPQIRQVGVDTDGNPVTKKFPVSFNAIDQLRRKLGQAAFGKEAEGYEAIGADNAKSLYSKLSALQAEFAPAKKNLITNYEEASRTLDPFKTGAGKKASAVERFGDEIYKTDASTLPGTYFNTRQSVKDLIELTGGDRALVEKSASDYVARQLQGKNQDAIKKFVFDNKEWMQEFPSLSSRVNNYISSLARSERVVPRTEALSKALKTEIKTFPIEAEVASVKARAEAGKESQRVIKESQAKAKQTMKTAEKEAKEITGAAGKARQLLGPGDPVKQIEGLILGGQTEKLAKIAPYIKADSDLMQNFSKAVDISLSRMKPAEVYDQFTRYIRPALENTGLISEQKAKELERQIRVVQLTMNPSKAAEAARWIIGTAISGEIGQKTSPIGQAGIEGTFTAIKDINK
jgi:cell division septum initiation protein DivIVA